MVGKTTTSELVENARNLFMSLTTKRMLGESVEAPKPFADSPLKKVVEATRPVAYHVCPHCNTEIYERHTWIDGDFMSGQYVERHSDCGGAIEMPETKEEDIPAWLKDSVHQSRARHQAYLAKLRGT